MANIDALYKRVRILLWFFIAITPQRPVKIHQPNHAARLAHQNVLAPHVHVQQTRSHRVVKLFDVLIEQVAYRLGFVEAIAAAGIPLLAAMPDRIEPESTPARR